MSVTIFTLFSVAIVSFERKLLLVRKGLTVSQNALLLAKLFPVILRKYAFLTDLVNLLQSFLDSFKDKKFFLDRQFWYLLLVLDLLIITLLSSFAMKGPRIPLIFLTFKGACLSGTNLNDLVKVEYISLVLLHISPFSSSWSSSWRKTVSLKFCNFYIRYFKVEYV